MDDFNLKQDASGLPEAERRKFLASCGRFAVVTPPAITFLMSSSLTSQAIAKSGGGGPAAGKGGGR